MGSQHPSPNVKNLCTFEPQIWLEIITSRDAQSTCFKGSQTSCTEIISGVFWPKFGRKNHITWWMRPADNSELLGWPRSTVEKGPQSNESYERENPWNRTISTVLWVHRKLPQSTVKLVLPSNESYESKTGCNRTLATVLWVPLNYYAVVFLLRPFLLRCEPFFEAKSGCNSQENGVRTRCTAIVNHSAIENLLRVVFLVRWVLWAGLHSHWCRSSFIFFGAQECFFIPPFLGASQMTTKFLTLKFAKCTKFDCHGISQEKWFCTIFPQFPSPPDPLQNANFINIVVSASLTFPAYWGHFPRVFQSEGSETQSRS